MTPTGQLALVATNPAAGLLLMAVLALWMGMEAISRLRHPGDARSRQDRGSNAVLGLGCTIAVLAAMQFALGRPTATLRPQALFFWLGVTTIGAGLTLRFVAVRTLGRLFTGRVTIVPGHELVVAGPYRFIRHPAYLGTLIALAGLGLALTNWLSVLSLGLVIAPVAYRIRVEERALGEALGDAYRDYTRRTARLLPIRPFLRSLETRMKEVLNGDPAWVNATQQPSQKERRPHGR